MPSIDCPDEALAHLRERDERLRAVIDRIGPIRRERSADVFTSLIHSFVAQQISTSAAQAIWDRLFAATNADPAILCSTGEETLRSFGLSSQKAKYIRGAAQAVVDGSLCIESLETMDDDGVKRTLCELYGVGVWTAEMLMIFSLNRPDIISCSDGGILRGIRRVYGLDEVTPEFMRELKARVSPFGTVASLYFWAVAAEKRN
jgi:DNA-3-methyladenine glycosylase II